MDRKRSGSALLHMEVRSKAARHNRQGRGGHCPDRHLYFSAWFSGYWVEEFDGSSTDGLGCNRNCTAKLLKPGRTEWWVKVKIKDGEVGWTKDGDKFDGKDALASVN